MCFGSFIFSLTILCLGIFRHPLFIWGGGLSVCASVYVSVWFFFFILGWVFSLFIFARSVVSIWDDFVSRAYVTMSIDSFVFSSRGQGTTDISWVQIRDATTKHLKVDMAFPPQKKITHPQILPIWGWETLIYSENDHHLEIGKWIWTSPLKQRVKVPSNPVLPCPGS